MGRSTKRADQPLRLLQGLHIMRWRQMRRQSWRQMRRPTRTPSPAHHLTAREISELGGRVQSRLTGVDPVGSPHSFGRWCPAQHALTRAGPYCALVIGKGRWRPPAWRLGASGGRHLRATGPGPIGGSKRVRRPGTRPTSTRSIPSIPPNPHTQVDMPRLEKPIAARLLVGQRAVAHSAVSGKSLARSLRGRQWRVSGGVQR